jgi:hypothetical protein
MKFMKAGITTTSRLERSLSTDITDSMGRLEAHAWWEK